jgi:hypothetical protein
MVEEGLGRWCCWCGCHERIEELEEEKEREKGEGGTHLTLLSIKCKH